MRLYGLIVVLLLSPLVQGHEIPKLPAGWTSPQSHPEQWSIPDWVRTAFSEQAGLKVYQPISRINPYYLRGDFNGDGKVDVAVFVKHKKSNKQGIAILHFGENAHIVGAGNDIRIGGDDFNYIDIWWVHRDGTPGRGVGEGTPPEIKTEALYIGKSESASAIIYWTGKKYQWYHQGD